MYDATCDTAKLRNLQVGLWGVYMFIKLQFYAKLLSKSIFLYVYFSVRTSWNYAGTLKHVLIPLKGCFMFIFSAKFEIFYGLLLFLWMDVKIDDAELKNRCK